MFLTPLWLKTAHRWRSPFALALAALAVAALAGIGALAVDSIRYNAERRRAQIAVDAAALAWATASLQDGYGGTYNRHDVQAAIPAYNVLADQGYYNILGRVLIEAIRAPASGPERCATGSADSECLPYFQVILHLRLDPALPRFAESGNPGFSREITVEAVARVAPPRGITADNALMATRQDACPGMIFRGGANIQVTGGNIFSNSTASSTARAASAAADTGSCHSAVTMGSPGSISVHDGDIRVAGDFQNNAGAALSPTPQQFAAPRDLPDVPAPDCAGLPPRSQGGSAAPLEPGIYSGITINNGAWNLNPGMYCLNGDFTVSGGSLRGQNVIIVMNGGSIAFSSSANIILRRPNEYVDPKGQHFPGMLIYMPGSNHGGINLSGSSGSYYTGTVYAPGPRNPLSQEKCTIGSSGASIDIRGSILCSTVGIAENAQVTILYKEEENFRLPEKVELVK